MARKHYAKAIVSHQNVPFDEWMEVIRNQNEGAVPKDHVNRIAKTVLRKCDPNQYLLSHATIVASVDTYAPKGAKTGTFMNRGAQIDVRYPDYRIKPECTDIVNNNGDAWARPLLLSTYRTFIGADNYCFAPDTRVLMADGTLKVIQDINVGEEVVSHTGSIRKVVHKFERHYEGDIKQIYVGHRQTPITVTPDHKFYVLDRKNCAHCEKEFNVSNRPSSNKQRLNRKYCNTCSKLLKNKDHDESVSLREVKAGELQVRNILFSPITKINKESDVDAIRFAKILGYYLAEGCIAHNGVVFVFGTDDIRSIQDLMDSARALYPGTTCSVSPVSHSDKCLRVTVYNRELANRLLETGGKLAHAKKLSLDYMNSIGESEILALIGAYASGDGDIHLQTNRIRICSVSEHLLQQILFLGTRVGLNGFIVSHTDSGVVNYIKFKDGSVHEAVSRYDSFLLHFDTDSSAKVSAYIDERKRPKRDSKSGDLRFVGDKRINTISKIDTISYSGMVYNLEVETDHSYIVDGIVAAPQCEHVQLKELSKGFIVDAIARDLGNSCYIDILVATDRKHTQLVSDILSGDISALSMGCVSLFTICTKCGNVAADESQLCPCIQYEGKGTEFIDESGQKHKISELIGHVTVPNSNQFIEASWVKNPAFAGAVRRNFLNQNFIQTAAKLQNASNIYELKRDMPDLEGMKKAAFRKKADQDQDIDPLDQLGDSNQGQDPGQGQGQSQGDAPSQSKSDDKKPSDVSDDKINGLLDKIQEQLLTIMVDKLGEKLQPKPEDVGAAIPEPSDLTSGNDNVIRSSQDFNRLVRRKFAHLPNLVKWAEKTYKIVHDGGIKSITASSLKPRDLIILSWIVDSVKGSRYSADLYNLSMQVGPSSNYPSEKSFLAACEIRAGRSITDHEKNFLIRKGRIASVACLKP